MVGIQKGKRIVNVSELEAAVHSKKERMESKREAKARSKMLRSLMKVGTPKWKPVFGGIERKIGKSKVKISYRRGIGKQITGFHIDPKISVKVDGKKVVELNPVFNFQLLPGIKKIMNDERGLKKLVRLREMM